MDDKIRRFIECHIPITRCNLRCHYCYITQEEKYNDYMPQFAHSADEIAKALSPQRMGGICMLNVCGAGETLLPPEITDIVYECLQLGNYVTLVTNGTITKRINEIVSLPFDLRERIFFKISFHYLELKRLNILNNFFSNIRKVKDAGCSFAVEITPCDELIPYIDEIKRISLENIKALPHITIARDETKPEIPILSHYNKEEFGSIWKTFDSPMLDFKLPVYGEKRNEFCYAGDCSFVVNLVTGDTTQCYRGESLGNLYENGESIKFKAIGKNCSLPHCYNAHSFLLWGDISNFSKITYADIRNRVCSDGSEWLTPKMKAFMSTKLLEGKE
jgi:pyruvate-formate lyase-activating enzyme